MKHFLLFVLVALAGRTYADGTRGGGDEIGLKFQSAAASAYTMLANEALTEAQRVSFTEELSRAQFVVVDEDLYAKLPNAEQNSVAVNLPPDHMIYINRSRVRILTEMEILQIGLHEVLSLIGVEKTGDYHLSRTLSVPSAPGTIPGSVLLMQKYYDDTSFGYSRDEADRACLVERQAFAEDYKVIYCAFLSKNATNSQGSAKFGIKVFGYGYVAPGANWRVLFSSLYATVPAEFASASEALYTCAEVLAETLGTSPKYIGSRCFVQPLPPPSTRFFYEIKTNAQIPGGSK